MAQHSHVPKFGNWEGDDNVPYTQCFDDALKGRRGKKINTTGTQENPDAFPEGITAARASPLRNASEPEIPKSKYEQHRSREGGDLHRLADSPARHEAVGWRPGTDSSPQQHEERMTANDNRRTSRMSAGSERSIDRSPLHPHHQVKAAGRGGVSSPTWERKGPSEAGHGFAPSPSTAGISKLRTAGRGGNQPADTGSTVPKFGDWDESNPSAAVGYTHIFNKVREEKQVGAAKVPIIKTDPVYDNGHRQDGGNNFDSSSCSCFYGWCRK